MATTVIQSPKIYNAAYTKLPYLISGSTNTSQPQFQYVMDVYESGSGDFIVRTTQTVNPYGVAIFDPSTILQGQLSYDDSWKMVINSGSLQRQGTFIMQFGEQYGTSPSSSVTVYPNQTSSEISVIPAQVFPYAQQYYNAHEGYTNIIPTSSFDLTVVDPIIAAGGLADKQLSTCPYDYSWFLNNPYYTQKYGTPTRYTQYYNFKPIGVNDYETLDYPNFLKDGISGNLQPAKPRQVGVYILDDNGTLIFNGLIYDDLAPVEGPYYSGSIDGILTTFGVGPMNLRDIPMSTGATGSLGNQTFGQIIDSGSWLAYGVNALFYDTIAPTTTWLEYNHYINEEKIDLLPNLVNSSFSSAIRERTNLQVPYPNNINCTEKTRFAFINKYGVWDYYTNWNPVRRNSNIQRQSVTLPFLNYSNNNTSFDGTRRGQKDYYIDRVDRFVVDTPPLDKPTADWIAQLIESPSVYIQRGNCFEPIIITNSNFTNNNDTSRNKLFQYTIEFEPANQPYGDWDYIPPSCEDNPVPLPTATSTPTPTPTPTATGTPTPTPTPGGPTPTPTPTATSTPTPTPTNTPIGPTPTPTPTNTPVPSTYYARFVDCDDPAGVLIQVSSTSPISTSVVLKDGPVCYQYYDGGGTGVDGDISTFSQFIDCATCQSTTPTPTPTPSPTPIPCTSISLEGPNPSESFTCTGGVTYYMNSLDFCTATSLYRQSDCTRLALPGWYHDFSQTKHRYWNGSAFTTSCAITACP